MVTLSSTFNVYSLLLQSLSTMLVPFESGHFLLYLGLKDSLDFIPFNLP